MKNRRSMLLSAIIIPIFLGATGLMTAMARPRFQEIHTVDVIQLLASGMLFGVGLAAMIAWIRSQNTQ